MKVLILMVRLSLRLKEDYYLIQYQDTVVYIRNFLLKKKYHPFSLYM